MAAMKHEWEKRLEKKGKNCKICGELTFPENLKDGVCSTCLEYDTCPCGSGLVYELCCGG